MAFQQIDSGPIEYPKYAECEKGTTWEGTYTTEGVSKFDKPTYTIETDKGTVLLNGSGTLPYKMSKVEKGALVQVVYSGMEAIKNGEYAGTMSHQFQVLVDDGKGDDTPFA